MDDTYLRLGVNIDHVATIRNARGGDHPDPVRAAHAAREAGADGITAHLREDRRHIRDADIHRLSSEIGLPLNLEMAATPEMLGMALRHRPHAACIVPEKREEQTTEGGLDVAGNKAALADYVGQMTEAGIRVSMFIEPDLRQIDASSEVGAPVIELHTGRYCHAAAGSEAREAELVRIVEAAAHAESIGTDCHAGPGPGFDPVMPVAAIAGIRELNIGHFLIGEAIFGGLDGAIKRMRTLMDQARASGAGQRSA